MSAGGALASVTLRPAQWTPDGTLRRLPITPDCRVHVLSDEGTETLHPCGTSLSLPVRARTLWIEQGDAISGQVETPLAGPDIALPLVPAGEVSLADETGAKRTRVMHAGATRFARDFPIGQTPPRIRVPSGGTVALYFDERGDVAGVATGRAMLVKNPVSLAPDTNARGATVVGFFSVAEPVDNAPKDETAESLGFRIGADHPAEQVIDRGSEIITLWRALESGAAELTLQSRLWQLAPIPLRLREHKVTTIRGALRPLPRLTVTVHIAEEFRAAWQALEPTITLRRTADRQTLQQLPATLSHEFPRLAVDSYDVVLTTKPWAFTRRADLSGGDDGAVEFVLKPFTITGKVTIEDEPAAATIKFGRGGADSETIRNDAAGEYSITLWAGGMYLIETTVDGAATRPPFSKLIRLSTSRELDIRIPRTDVVVSVTDAATNQPIPHAQVGVMNRWSDPQSGKASGSHRATTDSSGRARLAPMNPGTAEIEVTADGYFKGDPVTIAVEEDGVERVVGFELQPTGERSVVRIVLPNGAPAVNAEVLVVGDPAGKRMLWSGRADERGQAGLPKALEQSIVLVHHPAAGGLARRFQNIPDQEYRLPPTSPAPLTVRVERDAPATYAAITVWFDGLPLSWSALQFLTEAPPHLTADGSWTARNLPAGPLRILASSGSIDAAIAAGAYDALATTVPEPRPNQITLRAVD